MASEGTVPPMMLMALPFDASLRVMVYFIWPSMLWKRLLKRLFERDFGLDGREILMLPQRPITLV